MQRSHQPQLESDWAFLSSGREPKLERLLQPRNRVRVLGRIVIAAPSPAVARDGGAARCLPGGRRAAPPRHRRAGGRKRLVPVRWNGWTSAARSSSGKRANFTTASCRKSRVRRWAKGPTARTCALWPGLSVCQTMSSRGRFLSWRMESSQNWVSRHARGLKRQPKSSGCEPKTLLTETSAVDEARDLYFLRHAPPG